MNTKDVKLNTAVCKVYTKRQRAQLGKNLKGILQNRDVNISQLARKAEVSRKAVQDWIKGVSIPTNNTIDRIASALGMESNDLINCSATLDVDYLRQKLLERYDPLEHYDDNVKHVDYDEYSGCLPLDVFLATEVDWNYKEVFLEKKFPDYETQKRVAEEFSRNQKGKDSKALTPNDLFKPLKIENVSANTRRVNIHSAADIDVKHMLELFAELDETYQKIVYNSVCDFYEVTLSNK